jgi:hypothetical protein
VVEGEAVAGERELVLGPALDVLEGEVRDAAGRDPAQLFDRERAPKVRARVVAPLNRPLSS